MRATRTGSLTIRYAKSVDQVTSQSLALEDSAILTWTLLNTFRFGFSRNVPLEKEVQEGIPSSLYFVPTIPLMGAITITNGPTSVGQGVPGESRGVNSFQFVDDMTLTKGRSTMKWRVNINR